MVACRSGEWGGRELLHPSGDLAPQVRGNAPFGGPLLGAAASSCRPRDLPPAYVPRWERAVALGRSLACLQRSRER